MSGQPWPADSLDPADPDPVPVVPAGLAPARAARRGAPVSRDAVVRVNGDDHPRLRDDAGSERRADGGLFIPTRIQPASDTYGTLGVAFTLKLWRFVVSWVIVGSAMLNAALAHRQWCGSGGGAARMIQPWRLLPGGARIGFAIGREVTRPVAGLVAAGRRAGARLALDALDALLASTTAEVATDRVLASPWTERTVSKALTGPLVGVAAREAA